MTTSEYRPDADDPDCPTFKIELDEVWTASSPGCPFRVSSLQRQIVLNAIDRWWADNKPDRLAKLIEGHTVSSWDAAGVFWSCDCGATGRYRDELARHLAQVIRDAGYRETSGYWDNKTEREIR